MQEQGIRILIVDDKPENLIALEHVLKVLGVEVIKASNGSEALKSALNHTFALAIIDVRMPGMDGYELAGFLRSQHETRNLPIIFLTAADYDEQNVYKAYDSGAVDFLFKPVQPNILLGKVGIFLELHRHRMALNEQVSELLTVKEELELANMQLLNMSFVDGLTGIHNRRYLDETLSREWKRAVRKKLPVSLIMVDIDGFKPYNDRFGHLEGDNCLRTIAQVLSGVLKRPTDFVARYGGEEFAVVLPDTKLEGASIVAEVILDSVRRLAIPQADGVVDGVDYVTLSLGVATAFPEEGSSPEVILNASDKALYEAKRSGKNRAVMIECRTDCRLA